MLRWERFALGLVLVIVAGLPLALVVPTALPAARTADGRRIIEVVARAPEAGGWSPDEITLSAGEPVRLRLRAEDVVHGFSIAHLGIGVERIAPGQVVEVDLTVDQPGRYRFYCDVWCSPQHYRMRGDLIVRGPGEEDRGPAVPEVGLDVDPDAPHEAKHYPQRPPSAARGAALAASLGLALEDVVGAGRLFAEESPEGLFLRLRAELGLGEGAAWDLLAFLWQQRLSAEEWELGGQLYARNCAACHGPDGKGDGPAAEDQPRPPVAFADAPIMAGATEAILRAKIVRGGMGTGMPYWGRIFDEDELRAVLSYIWGFLLSQESAP